MREEKPQMLLSKTCEYAIRAMIYIAQQSIKGKRIGKKEIVEKIESPEYFLAKILQDLSRTGFIQSTKGPNGGFFMDEKQLEVSLAEIVRGIDGNEIFTGCGLGLKECSSEFPCPIHYRFTSVRNELENMLKETTVSMLVESLDLNLTFLKK